MAHLSIRDLQKISGEAISALPGMTAIKSGQKTVGLLIPIRRINPDDLRPILERAEALAKGRDVKADDEALRQFGEVDPVDWNEEAVRAVQEGRD